MTVFETGCFDTASAFAAHLGPEALASSISVLSLISLTYLSLPFAVAMAGTIRWVGAGERQ